MRRALGVVAVLLASASDGGDKKVSAREEIARLEKELAAQRALLVRMLELQNACTAQMIHAVQGLEVEVPAIAEPVAEAPRAAPPAQAAPVERSERVAVTRAPAPAMAAITGKVRVAGGVAWVFVEDVKGVAPGAPVAIKQEDKQFVPDVIAVPSGTRVTFPNLDVVYHNVFSLTPGQAFDLGMQRAGDPVKTRVMSKPGVVEIFCNLHARMSATVLVAPGPLLTKVGADGSFTLENVPVGAHRVSAWAGGRGVVTQNVDVAANGATVQFQLEAPSTGAHTNKNGQAYGSYAD